MAAIGTARVCVIPEMDDADIDALADRIAERVIQRLNKQAARVAIAVTRPAQIKKP